jgi:hypothetical protein
MKIYKIYYYIYKSSLILFIVILLTIQIPSFRGQAQAENLSVQVAPSVLQIRTVPPANVQTPITITNDGTQTIDLRILFKIFKPAGDETGLLVYSNPQLSSESQKETFLKNVHLVDNGVSVNTITLGPKQRKDLQLHIDVNKDAKITDYYFSILFLSEPQKNDEQDDSDTDSTSVYLQEGLSIPVLLAVGPKSEPDAYIEEFTAPLFSQTGPVPFKVRIKNSGTHFVTPKGAIMIKNLFGQTVGRVDLPPTNILSGTTRAFTNTQTLPEPQKPPEIIWPEKFLLGFYTATISLAVSDDGPIYNRSIYFAAFPTQFIVGLFITIIAGGVFIYQIRKRLAKE